MTPCEEDPSPEAKLLRALYGQKNNNYRDTSLRVGHGTEGRVIDVRIMSTTSLNKEDSSATACEIFEYILRKHEKFKLGIN